MYVLFFYYERTGEWHTHKYTNRTRGMSRGPSESGLTPAQFAYLSTHYSQAGFVADPVRVDSYTNPAINVADRNWQELLRGDPGYGWSKADQASWKTNCGFGPHNAASELDKVLFKK